MLDIAGVLEVLEGVLLESMGPARPALPQYQVVQVQEWSEDQDALAITMADGSEYKLTLEPVIGGVVRSLSRSVGGGPAQ